MRWKKKWPTVYILASKRNGTLYVGVTSNIIDRVSAHKQGLFDGFAKQHNAHRLVYLEHHATMAEAIAREKQLKRWRRAWKVDLIERLNPEWRDLFAEFSDASETTETNLR